MTKNWLNKPYKELPKPIVLKSEERKGYIYGRNEGQWIVWDSQQQNAPQNSFFNKNWIQVPFGFEGTINLVWKLSLSIEKARRYNLKMYLKQQGLQYPEVNYDDFSRRTPYYNNSAFSSWMGGTPCIIWQVGLGGTWCIATRYGVAEGIQVSIRKDKEWQLRHQMLVGFVWWMGKGVVSEKGMSVLKLLKGTTRWSWDDADVELWGQATDKKFTNKKGKYITMGDEKWRSLYNYQGCLKIGNQDVIPDDLFNDNGMNWSLWVEDAVNKGKNIGWTTPNGFRYETGNYRTQLHPADYRALHDKVHNYERQD